MKTVGSHWITEVPSGWRIDTPRFAFSVRGDRATPGMEQMTVSQQYGVIPQSEYVKKTGSHVVVVEKDFSILKAVYPGDFVIHMRSFQGGLELSEVKGCTSSAYVMLIPGPQIHSARYYRWVFKCDGYINELRSTSNFVRDGQAMRWANFIQVPIPFPPTEVQDSIAQYLDRETERIEELRDSIRAQIDALEAYKRSVVFDAVTKGFDASKELRPSGVPWIPQIPDGWSVNRGKYVVMPISRPTSSDDEVITCFRDGEVTLRRNRREEGFTISEKEFGYQGIEPGDLVVHGMDGFAGAIGISDSRGKGSPVLNVLDSDQNKRFLMYLLRCYAYLGVFLATATGIRVRSVDIRWSKIAELPLILPPRDVQDQVVAFLDDRIRRVDHVIEAKSRQLDLIEDYKKSLVYEMVTGKREVPVR